MSTTTENVLVLAIMGPLLFWVGKFYVGLGRCLFQLVRSAAAGSPPPPPQRKTLARPAPFILPEDIGSMN